MNPVIFWTLAGALAVTAAAAMFIRSRVDARVDALNRRRDFLSRELRASEERISSLRLELAEARTEKASERSRSRKIIGA